jgi:hypothetical protein
MRMAARTVPEPVKKMEKEMLNNPVTLCTDIFNRHLLIIITEQKLKIQETV